MEASSEHPDFDAAVASLLDGMTEGGSTSSFGDAQAIIVPLTRFLRARYPRLGDPEDVAGDAVARFIEVAMAGQIDRGRRPAAYLTRIAQNAGIDRLRREGRLWPLDDIAAERGSDDRAFAELLERDATGQMVGEALGLAHRDGDHVAVQIVTHWLNLYRLHNREPSSRELAERAGVSHWTVNQALQRFRGYLPAAGRDP